MDAREEILYKAKLSEQAERYEDMAASMGQFVKMKESLTTEERNLLSVAYKNVVGAKRSALRVYSTMATNTSLSERQQGVIKSCLEEIKKELSDKCNEVVSLLNQHLIKKDSKDEAQVFYHKMLGDYYRYLAEAEIDAEKHKKKSSEFYLKATEVAEGMEPTNAIKLGLALNYSVFLYEIEGDRSKACQTAKHAFDEAMSYLDNVAEEDQNDTVLIVQLLRDNLTLWTSEDEQQQQED